VCAVHSNVVVNTDIDIRNGRVIDYRAVGERERERRRGSRDICDGCVDI
jgi:hypothetical protein